MAKKIFNSGRKKPPEPKRIARVNLRLTEVEKEDWEAKAELVGCGNNLSKFIRLIIEKGHVTAPPTIPAINKSTYFELGKIGTNLNQITTAINRSIKMGVAIESDPRPDIQALRNILVRIEQMLININMPDTMPDKHLSESSGDNNDC